MGESIPTSAAAPTAGATGAVGTVGQVAAWSATKFPDDVVRNWQRIVDLLASIVRVPSAVVTALEPHGCQYYTIVVSSDSAGNPFPVDQAFAMDIGTFCETVIKTREPLLVGNASQDDRWTSAPELQVGMVSYLGYPVFWPDGRVFGTICVLDDKTNCYNALYQDLLMHCRDVLQGDLKTLVRLSSELEEQTAYLEELFARVPEAIVMVDRDGRISRVNAEFTKIFGYTAEESTGRRIRDLIAPDDLRGEVDGLIERVSRSGDVFAVETVRRNKSGVRIPVSLLCVPMLATGYGNAGYLIYRDISESKRLQDEQRRYHELQLELAHANRVATIGNLSASIAHELNQPLTGILTNCGTCLRTLTTSPVNLEGARDAVRRTIRDANRASDIVARLRALFGKAEPVRDAVDLNEATREVVALSLAELEKNRVALRTALSDAVPSIEGDRVQLQQVVLNLLRNALDAMSTVEDRPRDLLIRTDTEAGEWVRLSVTDVGVGFDPQSASRLFDPFFSTKHDGMGVGLSVSRSIVESHGGRLTAALNEGGPGATFAVVLPRSTNEPGRAGTERVGNLLSMGE